jgi:broad specificity phosphatase PhoE
MVETIFLVRHGEAESNLGKYFGGWLDVPLTPLGKEQAKVLRKRLSHEGIGRIYCSDLMRAKETAALIGLDFPIEYSKELREKSYGGLEGVRFDNDTSYDKYHTDATLRPPGGGENSVDVQKRVVSYFRKKVFNAKEEKVLVVAHHGPLVLVACDLLGMPVKNWRRLRLGNCGLSIITVEDKIWRLKLWNSLSHYGLQNFKPLLQREGKIGKIK